MSNEVICIAHNFKDYDSYFILEQCNRQYLCVDQIANDAKLLSLSFMGLKFIDSMSFMPMALSQFPKAFGLRELKKGFFLHFFNVHTHQDYVGPIPAKVYYDPQGMLPACKAEFDILHAERIVENYQFDFHQELLAYCQSDVPLLKEGCQKFRSLAGFDPFHECITIASAYNRFFRKKCLMHTLRIMASRPPDQPTPNQRGRLQR